MFDKLEDLLRRFEEILNELSEPGVANDTKRFQRLMRKARREYRRLSGRCMF